MTSHRRIYYLAVLVMLGTLLGPADALAVDPVIDWGAPHVLSDAPSGSPVAASAGGFVTVDASSLEDAADEVTTTIHHSADGWAWAQVRELPAVYLSAVVAAGPGYVAVGRSGLSELQFAPAVWLSGDGTTWQQATVTAGSAAARPATAEGPPFEGSWMTGVAEGDGLLVAIGNDGADLPVVWTSVDGETWTEVSGDPLGTDPALLTDIASDGSGFAVVGRHPLDADAPGAALAWWSSDGVQWQAATVDSSFGTVAGPLMSRLIATDDGYRLFGTDDGQPSVWSSADGRTWGVPAPLPVLDQSGYSFVADAAAYGTVVVAVGDDTVPGDQSVADGASIWVSTSSSGWSQVDPADLRGAVTLDRTIASHVYRVGESWVVHGATWTGDQDSAPIRWIGQPAGSGTFADVPPGYLFAEDIEWLWEQGITAGCNPPANDLFCPTANLTRGQTAAFLVRALGYTDNGGGDVFVDDDGSVFEEDIDRLATAGVTRGCNPPINDRFCPSDNLTRGQMAAFLVRALELPATTENFFTDDEASIFEDDINRLAAAGITRGCNPPINDKYCPDRPVTREQMAAFLARALAAAPG